jgi:hypothetical protein
MTAASSAALIPESAWQAGSRNDVPEFAVKAGAIHRYGQLGLYRHEQTAVPAMRIDQILRASKEAGVPLCDVR